jgi:hypothetical protein
VTTAALVPAPESKASPLPAFTGREMSRALVAYRELQTSLDTSMPDQIINLDGRPFRKKGYWRAVAVAFDLSVELIDEHRHIFGPLPTGGDNYAYLVTYRATTRTGRNETGDGACTAAEKSVGRMRATEHNVRSHAHTRAFNRAVSNLVGFGEVSAEEIEDTPTVHAESIPTPRPAPVPRPTKDKTQGPFRIIDAYYVDKDWHHVLLNDPPAHYKTKLPKIGGLLKRAHETHAPVTLDVTPNKKPDEAGYVNRVVFLDDVAELDARESLRAETDDPPA